MDSPIQLTFFKKLELYQELKSNNARLGHDKAWDGEKEILRWSALGHRHLGTPINEQFVKDNILTDSEKYTNFPDDARRSMENLIKKELATGQPDGFFFLREGLLMGQVIHEIETGGDRLYRIAYPLAWATAIAGILLVMSNAILGIWEVFEKVWESYRSNCQPAFALSL